MLVLTRKKGERIVIGEEITVEIVNIDGNSVRLGIVAPRDIQVDREEVASRKQNERTARQRA